MGDEPVQPHALLHPEKDPGKVGVIPPKVSEEAKELPKTGIIHWHKPVSEQDDLVQRTIRHRLDDFAVEERKTRSTGGPIAKTTYTVHNSPIIEQALSKVSAPLPALDLPLMAAKAGRRY